MNVTTWLDVAIGLGIVYLGASLFVTILSEYVSQLLNLRGRALFNSIEKLFAVEPGLRRILAAHPALEALFTDRDAPGRTRPPSYVDPLVLARAVVAAGAPSRAPALPTGLQALVGEVGDRTDQLVSTLGQWLDSSLTMLGEQYKRWIRWVTFLIGLGVTLALNVDTVAITARLYQDKEARDSAVALAEDLTSKTDAATVARCTTPAAKDDKACAPVRLVVDAVQMRNGSLGKLPIGYPLPAAAPGSSGAWEWTVRIAGWLLTALALSLGAPFWFDLLGKLVNIRHGMRKPEVAPASGGKAESGLPAPALAFEARAGPAPRAHPAPMDLPAPPAMAAADGDKGG